ncbi:hypothetical protein [Bradyrhizobium sp. SZCCHNRI3042]|uniref:hypothetical protein n=1 Tax=Bradyrhizobium sp. SZCCHNRI3042 TaxID=3057291 RepID=UPI002916AE90|nr:hypothetical protein [Bradyrhizobium sp. SZCCHNRI3042]
MVKHTGRRFFDTDPDAPPFLKALDELRRQATREGFLHHHVQAIVCAIDQYAEAATGNRGYFMSPPPVIAAGKAGS